MQVVLSDHNCEGQAKAIFDLLTYRRVWLELVPMELVWFRDVHLAATADDEIVWRFCQEHQYILLTGNRRTDDGEKSLEAIAAFESIDQLTNSHHWQSETGKCRFELS